MRATPESMLLGLTSSGQPLTGAWSLIHMLLWKFALINFTKIDLEDEKYSVEKVKRSTMRRALERVLAYWHASSQERKSSRRRENLCQDMSEPATTGTYTLWHVSTTNGGFCSVANYWRRQDWRITTRTMGE